MSILVRNNAPIKILFAVIFILPCLAQNHLPVNEHPATDLTPDWKLGMQLWTFKDLTFMEALEKTASLGLSWVEAYPGQKFSVDDRETVFDHNLPEVYRTVVKKRLSQLGLRLVNYGVVGMPGDAAEAEKIFKFAQDMGIETLNSEPEAELLPMVDTLCQKYNIRVALHNHPKPSRYWSPDTVMKVLQGVSPAIGVCGDIGHWMRSGLHPLDAIRKLEGRIITIHLKAHILVFWRNEKRLFNKRFFNSYIFMCR